MFAAAEGSTHGYDVVDPDRVDEAIGGGEAFEALCTSAKEHGLGVVVDLVPNHMATDHARNHRWWDLLRNGPASPWAGWFDLDWDVPERRLRGRLLVPVLPDHYGRELEAGAFHLDVADWHGETQVVLVHPSATTPIETGSLAGLVGAADPELAAELRALPDWSLPHDPDALARRVADEPALRARVAAVAVTGGLAAAIDEVNADVDALDALIDAQPYRLARWQTSLDDLTYRRFFDINTLVGVRVDRPEVFEATHALVRDWVERGLVDGLRVDHVDGLRDPAGYLERLREMAPGAWIVVEKILEHRGDDDEALPPWPIEGTTGYEAGELIGRLEIDDEGRAALERVAEAAGAPTDVEATLLDAKENVLDELLAADLNRLTESLLRECEARRRYRDVTRRELHDALRAALTHLPVYRTYARAGASLSEQDRSVLDEALAATGDDVVAELLRELFLHPEGSAGVVAARFQQLSGPVMAKGAEDTAWYRLLTLTSRCEVGADPDSWGIALDAFHDAMVERQQRWPLAMTATSTHDSKRSEDVRARLALLSQDADAWAELVEGWRPGADLGATSYRLLQTMVGAWPIDADRLLEHALKAEREAKLRTSWLRPDEAFEAELRAHVDEVLADAETLTKVETWVADHDPHWHAAVLAQKLLALTVPGVPDLYQGSEGLLVRLTDPDNRHPVDPPSTGSDKVRLVQAALQVRRDHPVAFGPGGSYAPLYASGPRADHAVAFTRGGEVAVVAPRKVMGIADGWRGTALALLDGRWTGLDGRNWEGTVDLDDLLDPVALLVRAPD